MARDIVDRSTARLAPIEARQAPMFCFTLLTVSCALASLALACATPFAAFAVIAAALLPQRSALLVVAGSWLVNQGIGFGLLHYPIDITTMVWGLVIGAAALVATSAASAVLGATQRLAVPLALAMAFVSAYAAFELSLLAPTPLLGGASSFSAAIVMRIGLISTAWLVALVAVCEITRLLNSLRSRRTA